MRVLTLAIVALPLFPLGCEERGQPQVDEHTTELRRSGGFTPEDNSAAYRPGDKGSPSGKQPKWVDAGVAKPDAGAPLPPPPLPQRKTPTPSGAAGGTLPR